jgi:hypothetical protein
MNWEYFRQSIFLNSLLAGFAFTIIVQLISLKDNRKVTSLVLGAFVVSASALLTAAFIEAVVLNELGRWQPSQPPEGIMSVLRSLAPITGILSLLGLVEFVVGVGFAGWIHSKSLGIISVVSMVLAFLMMCGALTAVSTAPAR